MKAISVVAGVLMLAAVASGAFAGPLVRVYMAPGDVGLVTGANQQFRVIGEDAQGNEVDVPSPVSWSTTSRAGTITSAGLFTASYTPGRYLEGVTASVSGGLSCKANVEVYSNEPRNGYVIERSIGTLLAGRLESPAAICIDDRGSMCVLNRNSSVVSIISWQGQPLLAFKLKDAIANGKTAIACDPAGNFYVLNASLCRVQKYSSGGAFVSEWGVQGTGDGQFQAPCDLAVDSGGNVYVSDETAKCIHVFNSTGSYLKKLLAYNQSVVLSPGAIVGSHDGCLYVGVKISSYSHAVQKLDMQGNKLASVVSDLRYQFEDMALDWKNNVYLLSGNYVTKRTGSSGQVMGFGGTSAADGGLQDASGIGVSDSGVVYIADQARSRVNLYGPDGSLSEVYPSGAGGKGSLSHPGSVVTDSQGNLYVADMSNYRVQKFDANAGFAGTLASRADGDSAFACPAGVTCTSQNGVYLTDALCNRVLGYGSAGTLQSNWVLPSPADPTAVNASPMGVIWDSHGYIFTLDAYFNGVYKLDMNGTLVASWGSEGVANGQFKNPAGVGVDTLGNVYVTDHGNNRVQKFGSTGSFVSKWGTTGTGNGQMQGPVGLCLDSSNYVYVADSENCRVQKFNSTGSYMAQLGQIGCGKYDMCLPTGVHVGANNALWVADTGNQRVLKYVPAQTRPISVTISAPTSAEVYYTTSLSMNISGTTTGSVTSVKWANDCGATGTCSGSASWSASRIMLTPGPNVISVTARDLAGNVVTDSVTVIVGDSVAPSVAISAPTSAPSYTTPEAQVTISGSAADNMGVSVVEWSSSRGEQGVCNGTYEWSANIPLHSGENIITVTVRDLVRNPGSATILVIKNTPDWEREIVDGEGNVGAGCSMVKGPAGSLHISYYDSTNGTLKYATWDGNAWVKTVVDSNIGTVRPKTSIAVDGSGIVHIAYVADLSGGSNGDIKYAKFAQGNWTIQVVDADSMDAIYPAIALTPSGVPGIAYYDRTNGDLRYAGFANSKWSVEVVDSVGNVGMRPSLSMDVCPNITYADSTTSSLKYATKPSTWVISGIARTGDHSSSLLGYSDQFLAYRDGGLRLLTKSQSTGLWSKSVVDESSSAGYFCALNRPTSSKYQAAYWNAATQKLRCAMSSAYSWPGWYPTSWILQDVDFIGGSVDTPLMGISVATDGSGNPCVGYYDCVNGDLKYAHAPLPAAPLVSITTNQNNNGVLSLAGTASLGVTAVYWSNGRGTSGVCSGTTSWTASGIPLARGSNYIYVYAPDSFGSTATTCLNIVWAESLRPKITVTTPAVSASSGQCISKSLSLAIAGTASDDVGVESVTWSNGQIGGYCLGTSNWSATVPLSATWWNDITVTAKDASGNVAACSFAVMYVSGTPQSVAQCKTLPDWTTVYLTDVVVSAVFRDYVYIQDRQRCSGIMLMFVKPLSGLVPGQVLDVAGKIATANNKERYISSGVVELK